MKDSLIKPIKIGKFGKKHKFNPKINVLYW